MATTTITIGAGSIAALVAGAHGIAALAGGAAILGAISLGVAGIALGVAKKSYHSGGYGGYGGGHHYKHVSSGYGGGGGYDSGYGNYIYDNSGYGSSGYGGSSYGRSGYGYGNYRRKKRSAEEESSAITNLLQVIRDEDVTGCGLKLVCELASLKEEELYEEEIAILNLVGPVVQPGEGFLPPGGVGDYKAAKMYGLYHGDCGRAFPLCPLNGTELMGALMSFLP